MEIAEGEHLCKSPSAPSARHPYRLQCTQKVPQPPQPSIRTAYSAHFIYHLNNPCKENAVPAAWGHAGFTLHLMYLWQRPKPGRDYLLLKLTFEPFAKTSWNMKNTWKTENWFCFSLKRLTNFRALYFQSSSLFFCSSNILPTCTEQQHWACEDWTSAVHYSEQKALIYVWYAICIPSKTGKHTQKTKQTKKPPYQNKRNIGHLILNMWQELQNLGCNEL